jgi:hypothetical protein
MRGISILRRTFIRSEHLLMVRTLPIRVNRFEVPLLTPPEKRDWNDERIERRGNQLNESVLRPSRSKSSL